MDERCRVCHLWTLPEHLFDLWRRAATRRRSQLVAVTPGISSARKAATNRWWSARARSRVVAGEPGQVGHQLRPAGPLPPRPPRPRSGSRPTGSSWESWSLTQCTFAVARPSCSTTGRRSSGSDRVLQSRSAWYGESSATTYPVPSSSAHPSHGSACACSADCDTAVRCPWWRKNDRAPLVVDDPARRRDVALLHAQHDVVLQRLGVPLHQQVVRRQPGASDAELRGGHDVLQGVGQALRSRLDSGIVSRYPAYACLDPAHARAAPARARCRPGGTAAGSPPPRSRPSSRSIRVDSWACWSAVSTAPVAVSSRSAHSWSRSLSTKWWHLLDVGPHVGGDQVVDRLVGKCLLPAHQGEAGDEPTQVPGPRPEVGLVEVVDVEDQPCPRRPCRCRSSPRAGRPGSRPVVRRSDEGASVPAMSA